MPDNYGTLLIPPQPAGPDEAPGDPLLDVLLSFFTAVLNTSAAAWRSVGIGQEADLPVMHVFTHDPEEGSFDKSKTPALYLFRSYNEPSDWIAHDYYVRTSQLVLYWVPPVVVSQQKRMRMTPFMNVIQSLLDNILEPEARHPAWVQPSDVDVLAPDQGSLLWRFAKIWMLDMGRSQWTTLVIKSDVSGMGNDAQQPRFPAVKTVIALKERNQGQLPEDEEPFEADMTLQTAVTAAAGPLDYLAFDFKLSLSTSSPTTGPAAGGTALVVRGTGMAAGASVRIGAGPCTDVDVSSPGVLVCTTPAGDAALGPQDVVVTNPDGTSATLANTFSYV